MKIHLITPVTTQGIRTLDELENLAEPGLEFGHSLLDQGPPSIESHTDEMLAVPGTLAKAIAAQAAGADAIIIDCMGDPGLQAVREVVSVPVLGPAETSMHLAAMLGHRFSIVTVLDSVKPLLANLALTYGVAGKLASIRAIGIPVLELVDRIEEVNAGLVREAVGAIENDDAHVIVLGCTGFLGCADQIARGLAERGIVAPVIDPIPATVCVAQALVKAKLRHSPITYPQSSVQRREGQLAIK